MKDSNKCEAPMGGWFAECEITDKTGKYIKTGIGKIVANVSYRNRDDEEHTEFTYGMCKDCVREYKRMDPHDDNEYNILTKVEWLDKKKPTEYFDRKVIISID